MGVGGEGDGDEIRGAWIQNQEVGRPALGVRAAAGGIMTACYRTQEAGRQAADAPPLVVLVAGEGSSRAVWWLSSIWP